MDNHYKDIRVNRWLLQGYEGEWIKLPVWKAFEFCMIHPRSTGVPCSQETPIPLGSPEGPRHRPTAGSYGGGCFLWARYPCIVDPTVQRAPHEGSLLGSENGTAWILISSFANITFSKNECSRIEINSKTEYPNYLLIVTKLDTTSGALQENSDGLKYHEGNAKSITYEHKMGMNNVTNFVSQLEVEGQSSFQNVLIGDSSGNDVFATFRHFTQEDNASA